MIVTGFPDTFEVIVNDTTVSLDNVGDTTTVGCISSNICKSRC